MNRYETEARLVFHFAREESKTLAHVVIDPEHLLLGLLRTNSTASRLLLDAGVALNGARRLTQELMMQGAEANRKSKDTDVSPRTRGVMERAGREAERLGSKAISTEHILLAILTEDDGAVKRVLQTLTTSPEGLRQRVLEVLTLEESTADTPQSNEETGNRRPNRPWEFIHSLVFGRTSKQKAASD